MIAVTYAPNLVEAAVLAAERSVPLAEARAFRHARNRLYCIEDADSREKAFRDLHRDWFCRFRLQEPMADALGRHTDLEARLSQCRVLQAKRRQEEGADVFDRVVGRNGDCRPLLVIRVRAEVLLDRAGLPGFLRHELMHITDMLDPRFGYRRTLPASDDGPSADNIVRTRYRTLWDVTIDGRLARQGFPNPQIRARRAQEFADTFKMLGGETGSCFEEWFDRIDPTHEQLVAFAVCPPASDNSSATRCPLCRFPVAALHPAPEKLSSQAREHIAREHPEWQVAVGLCAQCLDLYEARHVSQHCAS